MTVQHKFEQFHSQNPGVYDRLVALARQMQQEGFTRYSIKQLWGVLRWHYDLHPTDEHSSFKLNDLYYSRYARLIMNKEPGMQDFFKTRVLRTT